MKDLDIESSTRMQRDDRSLNEGDLTGLTCSRWREPEKKRNAMDS